MFALKTLQRFLGRRLRRSPTVPRAEPSPVALPSIAELDALYLAERRIRVLEEENREAAELIRQQSMTIAAIAKTRAELTELKNAYPRLREAANLFRELAQLEERREAIRKTFLDWGTPHE